MKKTAESSTVMTVPADTEHDLRKLLELIRERDLAKDNLLGLLHVLIGRTISTTEEEVLSTGVNYRDLARLLKKVRWDPTTVEEVGVDASTLPTRDRHRYWYTTICQAGVNSEEATKAGDKLAKKLEKHGYVVGPPPG